MFFQYYLVIIRCQKCNAFDQIKKKLNETSLNQNLPCGQTYEFTVKAFTQKESSADSNVTVSLKPADVEPVANLTVKYFHGNLSLDEESDEFSDRFLLTWDPPENLKAAGFEVHRNLDKNLLLTDGEGCTGDYWPWILTVQKP